MHWADGGDTKFANTVLLCRRHHRSVHEGGYQVCSDRDGQVVFFTPKGNALFEAPPMLELPPDPVEALVRGNRERGIMPGFSSGAPMWKRDRDVPWAIEAAALGALDPWDEPSVYAASVRASFVRESAVYGSASRNFAAHPGPSASVSAEIAAVSSFG